MRVSLHVWYVLALAIGLWLLLFLFHARPDVQWTLACSQLLLLVFWLGFDSLPILSRLPIAVLAGTALSAMIGVLKYSSPSKVIVLGMYQRHSLVGLIFESWLGVMISLTVFTLPFFFLWIQGVEFTFDRRRGSEPDDPPASRAAQFSIANLLVWTAIVACLFPAMRLVREWVWNRSELAAALGFSWVVVTGLLLLRRRRLRPMPMWWKILSLALVVSIGAADLEWLPIGEWLVFLASVVGTAILVRWLGYFARLRSVEEHFLGRDIWRGESRMVPPPGDLPKE